MAITFKPKTEEEIKAEGLLEAGNYPFTVIAAEEAISSKGNDMFKIQLGIHVDSGRVYELTDYITLNFHRKIHGFCKEVGMLPDYDSGSLAAEDMVQRTGFVELEVQPARTENGKSYGPKNNVAWYGPAKAATAAPKAGVKAANAKKAADDDGDDIPF